MRGKYTQVPADTFEKLVMNAGIMAKGFNPATGVVSGLMGATSGGLTFEATSEFQDFGDDVDNLPKNTKEMKQITDTTAHVSGTLLTLDAETARSLMAAADIDDNDATHIVPRMNLKPSDFVDIWIIADYSDENTGADAGYVAIHMINALNTGGFKLTTGDRAKGQFAFDYMAHFTMDDPEMIPFEVYVKSGATTAPSIELDKHSIELDVDGTYTLKASVTPAGKTVTWGTTNGEVATVNNGVVTAAGEGSAIVSASIEVDNVVYNDTCTVIVNA